MDSEKHIDESYEFYLEKFCKKFNIPYGLFALLVGLYVPFLILLLVTTEREKYLNWFINQFGFLWYVTIFLVLIMMRRLRDISVEIFLNLSYKSEEMKKEVSEYLTIIFAPNKLERRYISKWYNHSWFNFFYIRLNRLYLSIIIGFIAGFIGFYIGFSDSTFGLVNDIISAGIGIGFTWFVYIQLAYFVIGIILLIRYLSVKNLLATHLSSMIKLKKLRKLLLNLGLVYVSIIISVPTILATIVHPSSLGWLYVNYFQIISIAAGFLIIIPTYYVHQIVKKTKDKRIGELLDYLMKFDLQVMEDLKIVDQNKEVKLYNCDLLDFLIEVIKEIETINMWSLDAKTIIGFIISTIITPLITLPKTP